jgi:hypothetical protein
MGGCTYRGDAFPAGNLRNRTLANNAVPLNGTIRIGTLPFCTQDPSLRLKNGSAQDDAHKNEDESKLRLHYTQKVDFVLDMHP